LVFAVVVVATKPAEPLIDKVFKFVAAARLVFKLSKDVPATVIVVVFVVGV
jgi:RecA/RadA recombinase